MPQSAETKSTLLYWTISIALLLWGLGGASIYVAYFVETPAEFASTAEAAANQKAYAMYVANIPIWAIGTGIVAAAARLLGAICLLLRRAVALPLYIVSTIFFLITLFRAFVLANAASVMSAPHIAVEILFVALSLFSIWFANKSKSRGLLR